MSDPYESVVDYDRDEHRTARRWQPAPAWHPNDERPHPDELEETP